MIDKIKKVRTTINIDSELKNISKEKNINISEAAEFGIKIKSYGIDQKELISLINSFKEDPRKENILKIKENRDEQRFRIQLGAEIESSAVKYEKMIEEGINPFKDDSFWLEVEEIALKLNILYKKIIMILIWHINRKYNAISLKNLNRDTIQNIEYDKQEIRIEKERVCKLLTENILHKLSLNLRKKMAGSELKSINDKEYKKIVSIGAYSLNIPIEMLNSFCEHFCNVVLNYSSITLMESYTREEIIYFSNANKIVELQRKVYNES